jgi:hypothetical protein
MVSRFTVGGRSVGTNQRKRLVHLNGYGARRRVSGHPFGGCRQQISMLAAVAVLSGCLRKLPFGPPKKVVSVNKKLHSVAFRQSDDHCLIVSNAAPSIENLIKEIAVKWPDGK